jgi:hypothetical protein
MNKRFEAGSKQKALLRMATYAIRDQEALKDAYKPSFGEPDAEALEVIAKCDANIRDFRRIYRSLKEKK